MLRSSDIRQAQNSLYGALNDFSQKHQILGRLCSVPVSLLDVGLEVLKTPVNLINAVADVALNLVGAAFAWKGRTLKKALINIERALCSAVCIPVSLVMAPLKVVFQFFVIIIDPVKANSIDACNTAFTSWR